MCSKQDEIEGTKSKGLLSTKFERILEAATDGVLAGRENGPRGAVAGAELQPEASPRQRAR